MGPVHVAETRENVRFGLQKWLFYFQEVAALALAPFDAPDPVEALISSGMAVIGTAEDCIAQIERLRKQSGGFGCFLQLAHTWPNWEATQRSYEMIARYVMPHFQNGNDNRVESFEFARTNYTDLVGQARVAISSHVAEHIATKGGENVSPDLVEAHEGEMRRNVKPRPHPANSTK